MFSPYADGKFHALYGANSAQEFLMNEELNMDITIVLPEFFGFGGPVSVLNHPLDPCIYIIYIPVMHKTVMGACGPGVYL